MKRPRRKRPHKPFLFTLGSPAIRWASIAGTPCMNDSLGVKVPFTS